MQVPDDCPKLVFQVVVVVEEVMSRKLVVTAFISAAALTSSNAGAQQGTMPGNLHEVPFDGARLGGSIGWGSKTGTQIVAAELSEIRAGRRVLDRNGYYLGSVREIGDGAAIVRERGLSVAIPLAAFQRDQGDLRLPITVNEFRARARAQRDRS